MRRNLLAFVWLSAGCLIDQDRYERRLADLTDADGDGFVREAECDDGDASVHPDATEVCDGVDQDCEGGVDEDAVDAPAWYGDADGDGYGDRDDARVQCEAPSGYVADARDCDDAAPGVFPGASEVAYDGIDQDCSGTDADDLDGDGYAGGSGGADCDDGDAGVHPGAEETWENGFGDEDCDGEVEAIVEQFGSLAWTGTTDGAHAGRRLAPVGQLEPGGPDHFSIGAPFDTTVHSRGGAVYLVSGTPGGSLDAFPRLEPAGADWFLGASLAGGADLDGDAVPDLLVGATGKDAGEGAVWAVSGSAVRDGAHSVLDVALVTVRGDDAGEYAGSEVELVGDLDGDGIVEVAVSAPFADPGGLVDAGRVGIWNLDDLVDARLSEAPVVIVGDGANATIGNQLMPAGDVNGDGFEDLLVSGGSGKLGVVLPGGRSSMSLEDAVFGLLADNAYPDAAVSMVGDVDGDGARDLAALTPADVLVFTALAGSPLRPLDQPTATIRGAGEYSYFYDIVDLGDRDGDGCDDLLVPSQYYEPVGTSVAAIHSGADLVFGTERDLIDTALQARSLRPAAGFGYRALLAGDLDGDGRDEVALGGFYDDVGGDEAGAITTLSLPE